MVTWATDTAAYFGGMSFGEDQVGPKHQPEEVSRRRNLLDASPVPACGGGVCPVAGTALGFALAVLLLLSIAGQLGDLCESALNGKKSVKDSGAILPGHGGILDRVDSLAFEMPLLYIILSLMLIPAGP